MNSRPRICVDNFGVLALVWKGDTGIRRVSTCQDRIFVNPVDKSFNDAKRYKPPSQYSCEFFFLGQVGVKVTADLPDVNR